MKFQSLLRPFAPPVGTDPEDAHATTMGSSSSRHRVDRLQQKEIIAELAKEILMDLDAKVQMGVTDKMKNKFVRDFSANMEKKA